MKATTRAHDLMNTKGNELPSLALGYRNYLCKEVGGCMEVIFTAFCHYAVIIEGCEMDDTQYEHDNAAQVWFENNR